MMSRPAAFNSVARAVIAMVGEGLTRARRSARKGMRKPKVKGVCVSKLHANPPCCEAGSSAVLAVPRRNSARCMALDRRRPIWWFRLLAAADWKEQPMIKYSCTKSLGEDIFYATLIAESPQQAKEMAVEETNKKWS